MIVLKRRLFFPKALALMLGLFCCSVPAIAAEAGPAILEKGPAEIRPVILAKKTSPETQATGTSSREPRPLPQAVKAPVALGDQTLFFVQERIFSFSPEDRAQAITERIRRVSKNAIISLDAITVSEGDTTSDIVAGDIVIMSVTDRDARAVKQPRPELAEEYAGLIRSAIQAQRKQFGIKTILIGVLYFTLATLVLVAAIILSGRVFRKLYGTIDAWKGTRIKPLKIQNLELLSEGRIVYAIIKLLKALRVAIVLLLFYFYIPLVLDFFPWTRGVSAVLFEHMISPVTSVIKSVLAYIPDLLLVAVIIAVTYYINRSIRFFFLSISNGTISLPGFYKDWAMPTYKIVRFLVIAFAAVVVFPYLPGSKSPAFQGISIFIGVLFSLGSTSAVANMVAGIILTYMRPFKMGDRVKIADAMGDVVEKTILVTRLTTIKNVEITIPNAMVLSSHIINYSSSAKDLGLVLHTTVTIGYDVPWRKVHELLLSAAASTENALKEPAPFVLQTALDDFFVRYELNVSTNEPHRMAKTYSELHQNIQDKFNEAGVEILSPHFSALRDGNQSTIPSDYLPKAYTAPSFRINPADQARTNKE